MVLEQFWIGAAIAGVLCGAMLFLIASLQKTRRALQLQQEEKKLLEARIANLEAKTELLQTGAKGMGQRLMLAEKKLHQTQERQEDIASNNSEQLFRRQADRLLKGRTPPEDEESPSRSEAKLMALVGGKPQEKS